jgi:hypothetical protein
MDTTSSGHAAVRIMEEFAAQTGLEPEGKPPRRYLWTDAFAVCNYLALDQCTGHAHYLDLARKLVDQVHFVLGRHRQDDPRGGWISGLGEEEGKHHPTAGGLRIGKKMPERGPEESYDERLEWDRDGQYYHYLTRWMHALCRIGTVTGKGMYIGWAAELARRTHSGFCYSTGDGEKHLRWKMSIDLSRPLVRSMGHHDPLDGLLTCCEIQALARNHPEGEGLSLAAEISDLAEMCEGVNWATTDPLGLGGLLADALRLAQLLRFDAPALSIKLLASILDATYLGLSLYSRENIHRLSAAHRLAFRELGLAIGLRAVPRLGSLLSQSREIIRGDSRFAALLKGFQPFLPLGEQIVQFWLRQESQETAGWAEHRDINMVMLATALVPDGYLGLGKDVPPPGTGGH